MLNIFKTKTIYVKIQIHSMTFKLIETGKVITIDSEEDYGNHRLLISNFSVAVEVMIQGFEELRDTLILAPQVIIHPLENIDNELSEVEIKVLEECALAAGAKKVYIHIGDELKDADIKLKKNSNNIFDISKIFLVLASIWFIYELF